MKVTPSEYGFGTIENGLPDGPADNFKPRDPMPEADVDRLLGNQRELAMNSLGFPKPRYQRMQMGNWGLSRDRIVSSWDRDDVQKWLDALRAVAPVVVAARTK